MALGGTVLIFGSAVAQQSKLPVGVVDVVNRPIIERTEFLGRIQAVSRVNVVARVAAYLEKRLFTEGAEVKASDPLYVLEADHSRLSRSQEGSGGAAGGDIRKRKASRDCPLRQLVSPHTNGHRFRRHAAPHCQSSIESCRNKIHAGKQDRKRSQMDAMTMRTAQSF